MGIYDSDSAVVTDLSNTMDVQATRDLDTTFSRYIPDWTKWHGMYREIPELQAVIDKLALWIAGKGIVAKEKNKKQILKNLKGWGKDTARDIAINLIRTCAICGDSFASIPKNKRGELTNMKPLGPGTIEILCDNKGILDHYEQCQYKLNGITATPFTKGAERTVLERWEPEEMFHLSWNRLADENHGIPVPEKLEKIILMRKTAQEVMDKTIARNGKPIMIIEADTDDENKMKELKTKYENLINKGEAMVVSKDVAKLIQVAAQLNIDIITAWLYYLEKYFIMSEGVPEVILGSIASRDTEGASKILYLGFEQVVLSRQLWFEEQWEAQIGFEIELPDPPSLDPLILQNAQKSGFSGSGTGDANQGTKNINPAGENK
jgi:hypothetical protein